MFYSFSSSSVGLEYNIVGRPSLRTYYTASDSVLSRQLRGIVKSNMVTDTANTSLDSSVLQLEIILCDGFNH
jgi:hypothetical protein